MKSKKELYNILNEIKENNTFRQLKICEIPCSNFIHPNFASNVYNLFINKKLNVFPKYIFTNILKHIRNIRVRIKKNSKLTQKDILFMIFNKREIHEEIAKFLKIMDKEKTNLMIREPYYKEFGAYKLIPKDIDYSFFYSYIDSKIKKQWRKEKKKLDLHYKRLINDFEFRKIFIINKKNRWKEAKEILKNFFLEELYWSALIILITEKIIKIAKPKIYVNINCFSYCTREVAWTMKKEGVKIVHIQEGPMDYNQNFEDIVHGEKDLLKNLVDYYFVWGQTDKRNSHNLCDARVIGATKQPLREYNKKNKEDIVSIMLSTHSFIHYNNKKRKDIVSLLENVIKDNPSYKFILKLHPSGLEKRRWYKNLENLNNFIITKNKDLYSLLSKSRYVIVELSTIGNEAPIFDTDVITLTLNVLPIFSKHPIYFNVNNSEEISRILQKRLSKIKRYKKQFIVDNLYKIDGKTHIRIKEELENLLCLFRT